jgi:hypothetical protein
VSSDIDITFILGTGRCGSSLLQEVIARHPDCGFVSNVDDRLAALGSLGRMNPRIYGAVPPAMTRKGRLRFAPSEGYRLLAREVSPLMTRPVRDLGSDDASPWLAKRLGVFFERRHRAQGRDLFVHKLTGWPRAGLLAEVFPRARFVHVVRDGRAVANSLLQMPWWQGYRGPENWRLGPLTQEDHDIWLAHDRSFAVLAGLYWKILIDAFQRAEKTIDVDRWRTIRYEDLVAEPRPTVDGLLAWLGMRRSRTFERRFRRQPFISSRTQAYRRDLTTAQLRVLEQVTHGQLEHYGYLIHA